MCPFAWNGQCIDSHPHRFQVRVQSENPALPADDQNQIVIITKPKSLLTMLEFALGGVLRLRCRTPETCLIGMGDALMAASIRNAQEENEPCRGS